MIGSFIKLPWNDHFIDGIGKGVQARNGPEHLVFVKESIKIDISRSLFSFPLVTWVFLEIQVTPGSSVGKTCGEFCVSMASFLSVDLHWTLHTAHHSTCSPPVKSLVLYGPHPSSAGAHWKEGCSQNSVNLRSTCRWWGSFRHIMESLTQVCPNPFRLSPRMRDFLLMETFSTLSLIHGFYPCGWKDLCFRLLDTDLKLPIVIWSMGCPGGLSAGFLTQDSQP